MGEDNVSSLTIEGLRSGGVRCDCGQASRVARLEDAVLGLLALLEENGIDVSEFDKPAPAAQGEAEAKPCEDCGEPASRHFLGACP